MNAELVRCLSRTARGTVPPLTAAVGGLASQEVLKAITGKFAPLQQWVRYWTAQLLFSTKNLFPFVSSVSSFCLFSHHDSPGIDSFNNWVFLPPFCCLVLSRCHGDSRATSFSLTWGVFTPWWSLWWITCLHWRIVVSRTTQAEGIYGECCSVQMASCIL